MVLILILLPIALTATSLFFVIKARPFAPAIHFKQMVYFGLVPMGWGLSSALWLTGFVVMSSSVMTSVIGTSAAFALVVGALTSFLISPGVVIFALSALKMAGGANRNLLLGGFGFVLSLKS